MDIHDFAAKISDFSKWDKIFSTDEIENILAYQKQCAEEDKEAMVLRFLFEKVTGGLVMYPFYVWVVFHMDDLGVTSISVHMPVRSSSWLDIPDDLKEQGYLPIESVAFPAA